MPSVHDFAVLNAAGQKVAMGDYRGFVLLVVNVASRCGFTKQYAGLQELQDRFSGKPFSVIAFPCNQFGAQEPGTNAEVCEFAKSKYNATFPIMSKIDVNGSEADPLWEHLKTSQKGILDTTGIKWNFTKFLVDKEGAVRGRYSSVTEPSAIAADIEKLLA